MENKRIQTDVIKSWRDPQVVETVRDRDVVRMAKMIVANFAEVSKQTAHLLLKLAANAGKSPIQFRTNCRSRLLNRFCDCLRCFQLLTVESLGMGECLSLQFSRLSDHPIGRDMSHRCR